MIRKTTILALLAGALLLSGLVIWALLTSSSLVGGPAAGNGAGVTNLVRPSLAQAAEQTFLEKEAGITAYINLAKAIDLAAVKAKFRTVEKETGDYVVGSVALPGYDSKEDIHAFVTKDGWVAGYYGRAEPTSKFVDMQSYGSGSATIPNRLTLGLVQLGLGISPGALKYYHFAHPTANRLHVVAEADTLYITIPSQFAVFEHSFVCFGNRGVITLDKLLPDVRHKVDKYVTYTYYKHYLRIDDVNLADCGPSDYSASPFALASVYLEP